MPDQAKVVVTNTTPLIALTAATGNLEILRALYKRVVVPYEVAQEINAGGKDSFGLDIFHQSSWLSINDAPVELPPYLQNALDLGEASVIETALPAGTWCNATWFCRIGDMVARAVTGSQQKELIGI